MKPNLLQNVTAARAVSTPILAIGTPDQQACLSGLVNALDGDPQIVWDCVRGLRGLNDKGTRAVATLGNPEEVAQDTQRLSTALTLSLKLPADTVVYAYNAHRHIGEPDGAQAVSNVRERFKESGRTLILLGPGFTLPAELQTDVVVLEEEMPGDDQLRGIVASLYRATEGLKDPAADLLAAAIPAGRGLAAFQAEQAFALSMSKAGLDVEAAWERKKAAINQIPGLTLSFGGPTFADLGGLDSIRLYAERLFGGPRAPEVIFRMDEIEKMIGSTSYSGDGGVGKDALGAFLRAMEDWGWNGIIAVGPPGTAKTAVSRAFGATYGKPEIAADLGAMKGGIVGESEAKVRQALRVVHGIGGARVFVFATCNKLDALPTELRRRFRAATWFFDLPTPQERANIWKLHLKANGLPAASPLPDDTDWTGAEIRNCCLAAVEQSLSVEDAGAYVIPVARADADGLAKLRGLADGRFLSASYLTADGKADAYRITRAEAPAASRRMRKES